ncbi:MAG: aldehyde ferredoxin oxidoreductase family protein [Anaerolineae bacterium]|jgi:aldehyde:ferredoxin oxidoreductase|nr:aldehyde ferredoxin oxidoreductase family protein [Anaerolineae bacterium]MDX9830195.1 aldehyde ferredoxin oxidoreductase family protein [Anaerolineae bacterium]
MYGWHGRLLRVNLTEGTLREETIPEGESQKYIGGRGVAIKYLMEGMDPRADALSPENLLIMATGPLTSTPAPTGNRYMVVCKSPLTGALANSNSGGVFPTMMKRSGYDLYIFEGKAPHPVYLYVDEGKAELRDASHLWGKNTHETEDIIRAETAEDVAVACIGPAGENLALIAAIINDKHRAAARSGVGAVMGAKNLKAVAARGNLKPELYDEKAMRGVVREAVGQLAADIKKGATMRIYGTSYVPDVTNEAGILPTNNFQFGQFEGAHKINGPSLREHFLISHTGCYACPLACARLTEVKGEIWGEKYAGQGEGPEYETIGSLGSACGIDNLAAITRANYTCNELGLDTISVGLTIACAMEMYSKGIVTEAEIGQPLPFGDPDGMLDMLPLAAYRRGFGDQLAEGSWRLATRYGHPEMSITAKKLEFPSYDARGLKGMGLLYATSNIGASHMAGDTAYTELFGVGKKIDGLTYEGKAELTKHFQDVFTIIDSAGLCVFVALRYTLDTANGYIPTRLTEIFNHATGSSYTPDSLLQAAERVYTLERLFLTKAGMSRVDDTLAVRMSEPMPAGPVKGETFELERLLDDYYVARGWDANGIPTLDRLEKLAIAHYA